jgi:hypothetical protein
MFLHNYKIYSLMLIFPEIRKNEAKYFDLVISGLKKKNLFFKWVNKIF